MTSGLTTQAFFDEQTNTVSYLIADQATGQAAVIDPVLDFDLATGQVDVRSADEILATAKQSDLKIGLVLETHVHADHLSAAPYIKGKTGALIGIGQNVMEVQSIFGPIFAAEDLLADGSDFDRLFADGESFNLGKLEVEVLHVPGHTPADVAYKIADAVFVGDTLFMPDYGTARADFPGGDAQKLYRSIRKLLALPRETRLFMCHDYKAPGRDFYAWETTVGDQLDSSVHVSASVSEEEFVTMRQARDAGLSAPRLLLPSVQVNIRAGRFPPAEANGVSYLKLPVKPVPGPVSDAKAEG